MFKDGMQQTEGVTIALKCGFCNQPATEDHTCEGKQKAEEEMKWKKKSETSSTSEDASN